MIQIDNSVVINRPVKDVFAYVANFENMTNWDSELIEVKKISEGPTGVGTKFSGPTKILGRRIDSTLAVIAFEPNKKLSANLVSGPIEATIKWNFEPTEGGTKVTWAAQANIGGFFKVVEPIVKRIMQKQYDARYDTLKALLEAQS